jgi:UrcA family protein
MKKFVTLAAAMVFTGSAFAAQAEPRQAGPRTERVSYADLNLTSRSGTASLERRVREASGRVCEMGGTQTLDEFAISSRCYSTAVADGLRQMNEVVATKNSGAILAATALTITGR